MARNDFIRRTDGSEAASSRLELAWITDPHFDHVKLETWRDWADQLLARNPASLILTGDISEGDDVAYQLCCLAETFQRPIYFVLGNHDFYGKSISETRRRMIELSREHHHLHYLTDISPIAITSNCVILGEDGWGDAKHGDYAGSRVRLNDFVLIQDFNEADSSTWKAMLQREGQASAARLRKKLDDLPASIEHVLIATHVPPFREACWYEGKTTNDDWAPFFVCGGTGDVLLEAARANPSRQYTVICGHTHHDGDAQMASNLVVHTGYSRYGTLEIESLVRVTESGFTVPRISNQPQS